MSKKLCQITKSLNAFQSCLRLGIESAEDSNKASAIIIHLTSKAYQTKSYDLDGSDNTARKLYIFC